MVQKGYFIITDMTGYTSYLTSSELDHAQEILKSLFDAQVTTIKPPVVISNFQGDAILSYVPEDGFLQKQTLLEMIEEIYYAFSRKRELMQFNTTCTCNACKNIHGLDLKVFIHYGDFVIQKLAGREELVGPDVILAHRMMKNHVTEQTGIEAYALFTEKAAESLEVAEFCNELKDYKANYEYVGDVNMFVHCLKTQWEKEKEKRKNIVTKEDAWVGTDFEIDAPPGFIWDYITKVDIKIKWAGFSTGERTGDSGGRVGEDSSFHCAHGDLDFHYKVVDWRPFYYYTSDEIGLNGVQYFTTYLLTPTETGTLFGNYVRKPEEDPGEEFRSMMQGVWSHLFLGIKTMVEEDFSKITATNE